MAQYAFGQPLGYQQLTTALSSAQKLTVPAGARTALMVVSVQSVRMRDDGTAPTATVGLLLIAGGDPFAYQGSLTSIQLIATTSGAVVDVTYYGT
jgi:hypothetical protein